MTPEEVRKIVIDMKSCLDLGHIACEKCSPGFDERMRQYWLERDEAMQRALEGIYKQSTAGERQP